MLVFVVILVFAGIPVMLAFTVITVIAVNKLVFAVMPLLVVILVISMMLLFQ